MTEFLKELQTGENGLRSAFRLIAAILCIPFILSAAWAGTDGLPPALPSPEKPTAQDAQPRATSPADHLEPAIPDGRNDQPVSAPSSSVQPQTSPTGTV